MSDNNNQQQQQKKQHVLSPEQQQQQPQILKVPVSDAPTTTPKKTEAETQQQQQSQEPGAVDIEGKTNVSRGIIGLVTTSDPGYITEGTIADKVNPSTRFQKSGKPNPVTDEDLKKRMEIEREKAGMNSEVQEQRVIKIRTEMQGFKYTPPEHLKDIPGLAPTPDFTQEKEPNPDASQNESQITVQ